MVKKSSLIHLELLVLILLSDCILPQFERSKHAYTSVPRNAYHLGKIYFQFRKAPQLSKFCGETIFPDLRMKPPKQKNCPYTYILADFAKVKFSEASIFFKNLKDLES